jgi:DNA-directed RNA polymerase specialized sigma24 family protein
LPLAKPSFPTTRITLIQAAASGTSAQAQEALSTLCRAYWYPIYAYVRRLGFSVDEAEDVTQSFFVRVLEKEYLRDFHHERGRFRSFLLASLKHFVANERDRARALKRGGARPALPLDDVLQEAERRYSLEPRDSTTPEQLFERQWALTVLAQVQQHLREEAAASGKLDQFDRLKGLLLGETNDLGYGALAVELDTTEGALKVAVHRLRQRFKQRLREEIAQTVAHPEDVKEEVRYLMAALRS